ncbi:MAG: 50S ribosomal protein L18, partial [Rhodothermales bacterium]
MAKIKKQLRRQRVKRGIRGKVSGTADRPRLTIFRSNKHIYAQLIDDREGFTLAAASSLDENVNGANPVEIGT